MKSPPVPNVQSTVNAACPAAGASAQTIAIAHLAILFVMMSPSA